MSLSFSWRHCMSYWKLPDQQQGTCDSHTASSSSELRASSCASLCPSFHSPIIQCLFSPTGNYNKKGLTKRQQGDEGHDPAWKWSKHLTYRHHSEDGVDHTCTDSGVDRLLDTRIFEDSCRVVEHLMEQKVLLWNTVVRSSCTEPSKNQLKSHRSSGVLSSNFLLLLFNHSIFSANKWSFVTYFLL